MLNFLTTTTVCGFSLYHVLAFFLIYSCTGWCLEVIFAAATTGQLVNRGFLNGPVCPIYGFGMIIVLFALTPLQDSVLLLYIGGVILPSALELVGGWALYKLYHTRWWDYSDFPFNIGGYICLEFSLLWGVGTLVVMRIVHPVVAGLVDMVPPFSGLCRYVCSLCGLRGRRGRYGLCRLRSGPDTGRHGTAGRQHPCRQRRHDPAAGHHRPERRPEAGRAAPAAQACCRRGPRGRTGKSAPCVKRWPPSAPRPMKPARPQSVLPRLPSSIRPKPPKAAQLAAKGTMERAAELLRQEQLAEELQARSDEMQAQLLRTPASLARAACCAPSPA